MNLQIMKTSQRKKTDERMEKKIHTKFSIYLLYQSFSGSVKLSIIYELRKYTKIGHKT
jgi:hypothetical protein